MVSRSTSPDAVARAPDLASLRVRLGSGEALRVPNVILLGVASSRQFMHWHVSIDLAADPGDVLSADSPRPTVQRVRVAASF
jgi:hypothetical protein